MSLGLPTTARRSPRYSLRDMAKDKSKKKKKPKTESVKLEEKKATRQYTGSFGGEKVAYTATAATQVFEVNEKKASFFYVAYTKDDADTATRPVLFCFNGGPG